MKIKIINMKQPDVRPVKESGELYKLWADYTFSFEYKNTTYKFKINQGFTYDGASVPKFAWTLIGLLPDGIHRPAALIHDFMYTRRGMMMTDEGIPFKYDREFADLFFYEALNFVGLKSWHSRLAYRVARLFGKKQWNDKD